MLCGDFRPRTWQGDDEISQLSWNFCLSSTGRFDCVLTLPSGAIVSHGSQLNTSRHIGMDSPLKMVQTFIKLLEWLVLTVLVFGDSFWGMHGRRDSPLSASGP